MLFLHKRSGPFRLCPLLRLVFLVSSVEYIFTSSSSSSSSSSSMIKLENSTHVCKLPCPVVCGSDTRGHRAVGKKTGKPDTCGDVLDTRLFLSLFFSF